MSFARRTRTKKQKGSRVGRGQAGEQTTMSFARQTRTKKQKGLWVGRGQAGEQTTMSFARQTRTKKQKGLVVGRGQAGEQTTMSFARQTQKKNKRVHGSDEDRRASITTMSFARQTRTKKQKGFIGRTRTGGRANDNVVMLAKPEQKNKRVYGSDEDRRASKRQCRLLDRLVRKNTSQKHELYEWPKVNKDRAGRAAIVDGSMSNERFRCSHGSKRFKTTIQAHRSGVNATIIVNLL